CKAALTCPTAGDYCGNDGVGGPANVLYHCTAAGQPPASSQACARGCSVQPAGTNDVCAPNLTCPTAGDYCGNDGVGGDANTLYHCTTAGAAPVSSTGCSAGCAVQPPGSNDFCKQPLHCPSAGDHCGNDAVGGDASTPHHSN